MATLTVIAFDFGTKSIGVAATYLDDSAFHCSELSALEAIEGIPNWDEIASILDEWRPSKIIVGLPRKLDGTEMEITRRARKFGKRLYGKFGCTVEFIDETLSTKIAKSEAHGRGHKGDYGRNPIDSIAARLILETWLLSQPRSEE